MHRPPGICKTARIPALTVALALSCAAASNDRGNWRDTLRDRLPLYGHRNWIVVADSAYPAQARPAIETVVADEDQTVVLQEVLRELANSKHVRPIPYTDSELKFLSDEDVPGIEAFRQSLPTLLSNPLSLPHEQIISKLDEAAQLFRVLIIKTRSTLPYTSVFLQLDCAYWRADSEKKLRARMGTGQK
ncbi:MAG TPA: hypothetical protein VKX25_00420 [Bryobacteraceae bacterium]|jgi:hypothetical protein|nr:hypothetical protein [Bryobacteraceae bacterium]